VDPINSPVSGITKYSIAAKRILEAKGIKCFIVAIKNRETIEDFRLRLRSELMNFEGGSLFVEAPETRASTKYIPPSISVHIRLHFSKLLGAFIEGKFIDPTLFDEEKKAISRAKSLSTPSYSGAYLAKNFFEIKEFSVFHNPLDLGFTHEIKRIFDVGFVGRWQSLKGVGFLKTLIDKRPDLKFVIATDHVEKSDLSHYKNVSLFPSEKAGCVYSSSRCIVVTSLFETASMVALEAIRTNTKVITWSHIGVCEYAGAPYVYKVKPFDVNSLSEMVDLALGEPIAYYSDTRDLMNSFNNEFVRGIFAIIAGEVYRSNSIKAVVDPSVMNPMFFAGGRMTEKKELTSFQRKFRKLRRTPILFFVDVYKKKRGLIVTPVPSVASTLEKNDTKDQGKRRRAKLLCNIVNWDDIKFHDYGEKNKHLRANFIFDITLYKDFLYKDMLEDVYAHEDFLPCRREFLGRGYADFSSFPNNISAGKLMDSADLKQREKLSNINILFVFDCMELGFFEFLRFCNPTIQIVAVYTGLIQNQFMKAISYSDCLDCLIAPVGQDLFEKFRKVYRFTDIKHVNLWIRKVVQESISRTPNYLLPLYGKNDYAPELERFDTRQWSGLIVLKHYVDNLSVCNFCDYLSKFSDCIESVYVREDVYLRYKTVCDDIEADGNLIFLLEKSLKDGFMYDVKKI